jgi:hypothetical protein
MECHVVYTCECNKKQYPSLASLKQHKKTKVHQSWESTKELRDLKIQLTARDNEILSLHTKLKSLRELNTLLLERIKIEEVL